MTSEQFSKLVAAYGADVARWPEAERSAARALVDRDVPELREPFREASQLDEWLDRSVVASPDDALRRRIVAAAAATRGNEKAHTSRREPRRFWPGAGLVGVGLAGSLVGAFVVSIALNSAGTASQMEWPERGTAFNSNPAEWGDE